MTLTPAIYFHEVPRAIDMTIRSELYYINEFTFAVAVILSAQATDKKVNEVTPALFDIAPTPDDMLALGENGLKEHIKVISFFNNKAKNIIALSEKLSRLNTGNLKLENRLSNLDSRPSTDWCFPDEYHDRDTLMRLPGIGQKTANVMMNVLWGMPYIGVDTHVFRNAHRYGWVSDADNTPEKVERKLLALIPKKYHGIVNHVMVLHGRYICTAKRPKCMDCPVTRWCDAKDKNS